MDHFLSFLAAASLAFFPGAALVEWRRFEDKLEALGRCFAISLAVNCFAVMGLFLAGLYRPVTAWTWMIALAGATALLYRRKGRGGTSEPLESEPKASDFRVWGIPAVLVLPLLPVLYRSVFLPFFSWDAVASWNRWAVELVKLPEQVIKADLFYTLFNSFGMSFPYMISGNVELEFYAHAFSFIHLIVLYAALRAVERELGASAVMVLLLLFLSRPLYHWAGTGYADIGAIAYMAWALALYFKAVRREEASWAWWSGLAAATAYLFKQSVVPIVVVVPLLTFLFSPGHDRWRRFGLGARVAAGLCLAPLCWNLVGGYPLFGRQFQYVMADIHGERGRLEILQSAGLELIESVTLFRLQSVDVAFLLIAVALILLGAARNRHMAILALAGLAHLLVWANTVSYNERGAFPAFPIFAIVAVGGLQWLWRRLSLVSLRPAWIGLQVFFLAAWAHAEAVPVFALHPLKKVDWRPALEWNLTRPWLSGRENLALLDVPVRDLELWKEDHPDFRGRFWSTPYLITLANPTASGSRPWIDTVDRGGLRWRKGDVLFISESDLRRSKSNHLLLFPEAGKMTWKEWLEGMVERGSLRYQGQYGIHHSYLVVRDGGVKE